MNKNVTHAEIILIRVISNFDIYDITRKYEIKRNQDTIMIAKFK